MTVYSQNKNDEVLSQYDDSSVYDSKSSTSIETDFESSSDSITTRVLPERQTRGKRYNINHYILRIKILVGQEAECDAEFWNHNTWKEDQFDEDWYTEDEKHYKDYADSDFFEKTSSDSVDEQEIEKLDKVLQKVRNFIVYFGKLQEEKKKIPVIKQKKNTARVYANRPKPPPPACSRDIPSGLKLSDSLKKKYLSQEEHLKRAALIEVENKKKVATETTKVSWSKEINNIRTSSSTWTGNMVLYISWASNRLIDGKQQHPLEISNNESISSKDMIFFVNFDQPEKTSIPDMYKSNTNDLKPVSKERYKDPYLNKVHQNIEEFNTNRKSCFVDDFQSFQLKLERIDKFLQSILLNVSSLQKKV